MRFRNKCLIVILVGYGTGVAMRILYDLYRFRIDTINDILASKRAYDIMMIRVKSGKYLKKSDEDVRTDFEFYRISSRLLKD